MQNIDITRIVRNMVIELPFSTDEYMLNNKSDRNVLIVATLNAGSGDYNSALTGNVERWSSDEERFFERFSIAGKRGNDIALFCNETLTSFAFGGSGSLPNVLRTRQRQYRSHWRDDSGNRHPRDWENKEYKEYVLNNIVREGEVKIHPLVILQGEYIKVQFIDNGSSHDFKGFVHIALIC